MSEILDSGARRQFKSGAVRDIECGKGRCDLLPLAEIGRYLDLYEGDVPVTIENSSNPSFIFEAINAFMRRGDEDYIYAAIDTFINIAFDDKTEALLALSKHYEDGAKKYEERNWEKGIPLNCYIDSGIRHLIKFLGGRDDEPHDRAFLWNMFGLLWTLHNKPECNNLLGLMKKEVDI